MNRQEALRTGAPRYTGKSCKNCGGTERSIKNGDCVKCASTRKVLWQKENAEAFRNYTNKWRSKNPKKARQAQLKHKYNISLSDHDAMVVEQDNVCAICTTMFSKKTVPQVDHCHKTGKVRALLCRACNTAIGLMKENSAALIAAAFYIIEHE